MTRHLPLALAILALSAAGAQADPKQGCILAAAEYLPRIPGIEIVSTEAVELERPASWSSSVPPLRVVIGFKAAGQDTAYKMWMCAIGKDGLPLLAPWVALPSKS